MGFLLRSALLVIILISFSLPMDARPKFSVSFFVASSEDYSCALLHPWWHEVYKHITTVM
jgi:hypothetical protein